MVLSNYVVSLDDIKKDLGGSLQAKYIFKYLKNDLGAQTALIEKNYIDKDYLIDYAGYYARAFPKISKCTDRIHFFSNSFSEQNFEEMLVKNNNQDIELLKDNYLGFVVLKPLENKLNQPLIGRTLIKHLPKTDKQEIREYLSSRNISNLYGLSFQLQTLPFQAQDQAVSACATISLWTINNKIKELFQTPQLSPIEITNRASNLVEGARSFPSTGLSLKQMFAFFRSIELDCEYINITSMREKIENKNTLKENRYKEKEKIKNIVPDTVKAFTSANIPIIVTLIIRKYGPGKKIELEDYHAVIISGYKYKDDGNVTRLYVHDDKIGPYSRVKSKPSVGKFLKWENEWITDPELAYDEVLVNGLLIPLYPKIRLNFLEIYDKLLRLRKDRPNCNLMLNLMTVQDYKKNILNSNPKNKLSILKKPMPRFIWVIRNIKNNTIMWEYLFDATSQTTRKLEIVNYI